jgi:zinc transporter 1/2/3
MVKDKERELGSANNSSIELNSGDAEIGHHEAAKQLIGVAVLEFGVVLHSIIIGLTLAVNDNFIILFIVIIFHRAYHTA